VCLLALRCPPWGQAAFALIRSPYCLDGGAEHFGKCSRVSVNVCGVCCLGKWGECCDAVLYKPGEPWQVGFGYPVVVLFEGCVASP
jgi:hypothetical protein